MEPRNSYRKVNDSKERLRIVLAGLQPGVNKSKLCAGGGLCIQQLVDDQEALKGAKESLKRRPGGGNKKHDPEKEYLKQEREHLKELLLEQTKELSVLKKERILYKIQGNTSYAP